MFDMLRIRWVRTLPGAGVVVVAVVLVVLSSVEGVVLSAQRRGATVMLSKIKVNRGWPWSETTIMSECSAMALTYTSEFAVVEARVSRPWWVRERCEDKRQQQ